MPALACSSSGDVSVKISSPSGSIQADGFREKLALALSGTFVGQRKKGETYRVATGDAEKKSSNQGNSRIKAHTHELKVHHKINKP